MTHLDNNYFKPGDIIDIYWDELQTEHKATVRLISFKETGLPFIINDLYFSSESSISYDFTTKMIPYSKTPIFIEQKWLCKIIYSTYYDLDSIRYFNIPIFCNNCLNKEEDYD